MLRTLTTAIALTLALATALAMLHRQPEARADRPPLSLNQQVADADAILVGTVADLQQVGFVISFHKSQTDGGGVATTSTYGLALVHAGEVLKTDSPSIINKADKSNPIAWVHLAFRNPRQGELARSVTRPEKGDVRIWFLRHDRVLTGHYLIDHALEFTDTNEKNIKELIASQQKGTEANAAD